jgi:hypothetical protein
VDINWLGRPLETELDPDNTWGTDWGKVDPCHGKKFYPKGFRDELKRSLQPDAHSLDPILSPRNSNWFLLSLAGRRALTFLEQQPEVDPDRLGFAGFSMGGMITSMTSIDKRLKAVAPFIGGVGNRYQNYKGMSFGALTHEIGDFNLHRSTIDPAAYWPHVTVPVMFITSSNDQYAPLDRIYSTMDLLPHGNWRVSCNIHEQHKPGPEQWAMLYQWFKQHLAGGEQNIPATPASTFKIEGDTDSYGANPITRFWKRAEVSPDAASWKAGLPVYPKLPLYAFALCRYSPSAEQPSGQESVRTFTLNSTLHSHVPGDIDLTNFDHVPRSGLIDDFSNGMANWCRRGPLGYRTFKFQDPELDTSPKNKLAITLHPKPGQELLVKLELDGRYNVPAREMGKFQCEQKVSGKGPQTVLLETGDFKKVQSKNANDIPMEWSNIATFSITLTDAKTERKINLTRPEGAAALKRIELVKP